MVSMALDDGEALFERYLKASGYEIVAYHPDLDTQKRPDYLISAGNKHVVVEVESFNTPPLSTDHPRSGFVSMTPKLRAIRDNFRWSQTAKRHQRPSPGCGSGEST